MRDKDKTKEQLISELVEMRQRIGELETSETQGKRAEEALRRQEEYFRSLIENASDAIAILNGDGTIGYQSPSYERVLAYTPEEEIGQDMFDNIHPDDAADVADGLARILEHPGDIVGVEARFRHRDGSWHTLEATANNLLHDPAVEGIVVNFRDITERKQAEEALRDSEQKHRHLFENLNDAALLADVETGRIIETNKQAEVLLGRTREEIIGMHQSQLHPAGKAEEYRHRFASHIEKGHAADYDGEVITKNGSIVAVAISATPLTIGGKRLILGLFRDITERKRAEEMLRESEAKYSAVVEQAKDGVIIVQDEVCRFANRALAEILGYSLQELLDMPAFDIAAPQSKDLIAQRYRLRKAGQQVPLAYETKIRCKDGTVKEVESSSGIIQYQGRPAVMAIVRDISERKRAEEILRESEARYRLLAENITDVISCVDMNGQPTYMSPSVTRLLGFSVEEAMAHSLEEDGVTPASREVASKALARQLAVENDGQADDSKSRTVDLEFYRKDGSTVWVEVAVSFLRDSNGQPIEILTVLRDVSERKRSDEERERLLRELAEKTRELEQIVFVASHDLRSPLVNIQGFTRELEESLEEVRSALESEDIPSAVKERLAVSVNQDIPDAFRYILASSAKIDSLLSGLLRLSRLGRAALIMEKLDMNGLMADVARAFEFLIKEAGATLEVEDLLPCHGDKTQVNQVLSNLVDNALKFLQPGRAGVIRVSGRSEDGRAIYCVEDNGIGIAPEHQERVFEIFQRLDPSANSGEGLGLAIVRRILERHAGKAWVESEPGKGSKFFVSLPSV